MKKKVLIIVDFSLDGIFSGNRTFLYNYLLFLKKMCFEIHIHVIETSNRKYVVSKEFESIGVLTSEYQFFTHIKRFFVSHFILPLGINFPMWMWKSSRCNLSMLEIYDFVLINYVWNYDSVSELNIKKYLLAHDSFIDRNKRLKTNWVSFNINEVLDAYRNFDKVLLSNYSEYVLEKVHAANIDYVGLPFYGLSSTFLGKSEENWGFIGSKNTLNLRTLEYILDIFKSNNFIDKKLYIAGDVCDELKNKTIPKNVVLMGRVQNLLDFYDKVHVIFSIRGPSSGIKIKEVEAMAYGKIVVCDSTSIDCFPDIEGHFPPFISYDDFFSKKQEYHDVDLDYYLKYKNYVNYKLNFLFS